jgi:hypothetical protein
MLRVVVVDVDAVVQRQQAARADARFCAVLDERGA